MNFLNQGKMTESEIKAIDQKWRQDFLYDPFMELKITGKYVFDESNDIIFHYLNARNIIKVDEPIAKIFYQEERQSFLETTKRGQLDKSDWTQYNQYVANDFNTSNKFHERVRHKVRIRSVREFLNELVKQGKDIGEFFND
jgi:hypothetical protein